MAVDLARARRDTPGCTRIAHLNNAGTSLPPRSVLDTVVAHLHREAAIGGYEAALEAAERVEGVYTSLAALVGGEPDEIAVVDSATRAWDAALTSLALDEGDRVLVSRSEYGSNVLALLHAARRRGVVLEVVPDDEHGQLSVDALGSMLDDRVRLVAVTHVPTQGGLVNPATAIGRVTRAVGVPFLLDACQSVGQLGIDVDEIGCDLLSATGRKFLRAPRGTGFLWVRRALLDRLEPPVVDLRSAEWTAPDRYELRDDARRFELWERSVAGMLGLGAAADYALATGIDAIELRAGALAARLREQLAAIDGVTIHDLGVQQCAIVSFAVARRDPEALATALRDEGINVWFTTAGAARLDLDRRGITALVRASPHYFNTEDEVDRLAAAVADRAGC